MAEEIIASPEESVSIEAPISEAPVEVSEEVVDVQPTPPSQGLKNLEKLHTLLVENDVYSEITPEKFVDFVEKYKDPVKLKKLHSLLVDNDVYSQIVPSDINEAAKKYGFDGLGKPSAVPSVSGDGGSATKGRGVELRSTLPQTYSSEQAKADIESNVPGAAAMNLDYDVIAKKMQGKTPAQAVREQIQTIKDPVERLQATRSLYKGISSEAANRATQSRSQIEEIDQSIPAMKQSLDQMQAQIGELQTTNPQEASRLNEQYNQQAGQYNSLVSERNKLADSYEDDSRLIATMNAGRAAEYNIAKAKGEISRDNDISLAAMPMNAMFGTDMQYKPTDAVAATAWNAMAPNMVRALAGVTSFLPSYDDNRSVSGALLNVADSIEIDSQKYVPKEYKGSLLEGDVNPYTVAEFTGSLLGSVAGSMAGGTARAAQIFNASQGFGGMFDWGKKHGLTDGEAVFLAAPVGLVYGYLGDKGVEALSGAFTKESTKKFLLEEIKALGKNPSGNALMKVAERFLVNTLKGGVKEGVQEGVEFTSEFGAQKAGIESGIAMPKFGEDYSSTAYFKGLKENAIGGAIGGGPLGGIFAELGRKKYSDVVAAIAKDPQAEQDFISDIDELVLSGNITPEQGDEAIANLEKAKAAATKIPSTITQPQSISRATELIQEKEELTAETEGKDPAMTKPIVERISAINIELGDIAASPQVEEQPTTKPTKTLADEINVGDTVDLTPSAQPTTEAAPQAPVSEEEAPSLPPVQFEAPELNLGTRKNPFDAELEKLGYSEGDIQGMTMEQKQEIVTNKTNAPVVESTAKVDSVKENKRQEKIAEAQAKLDEEAKGEATAIEPKIILSGAHGGFQSVSNDAFDLRAKDGIREEINANNSFAKIFEYKGKKYVAVGLVLSLDSQRGNPNGRNNYSFAVTEYNDSTPSNILETLENSARKNFKTIYPDFKESDTIDPISSISPELSNIAERKTPTPEAQPPVAEEAKGEAEEPSSDKNYAIAQEVNSNVAKDNPAASVLIQPKGNDLVLTAVYVDKDERNKGIGTKVLESVKAEADRTGKKVVLDATNELDQETDLKRLGEFYERNGFTNVGNNKFEYNPSEATQEQAPQAFPAQEGAESVEDKFQANSELEQIYRDLNAAVNKNIDPNTLDAVKRNPTLVMVEKALRELERKGVIKIDCK
jgi:GNAT superfamily N-acetyltransferase